MSSKAGGFQNKIRLTLIFIYVIIYIYGYLKKREVLSLVKFCNKCGSPLEPSASFCTSCGAPVAAEETPAAQENTSAPANNNYNAEADVQAPVNMGYDDNVFDGGTKVKKPKFKKALISAVVALAVLAGAAAAAFFTLPVFQNFVVRTFTPKSTYLGYVLKQNLGSAVSFEDIGDMFNSTYDTDFTLTFDDELLDIIGDSVGNNEVTKILKAIDDAKFSTSVRLNDTQFAETVTATLNGKEIGTADISADFESQIAFIDLNELNSKALGQDIPEEQAESYLAIGKALSIIQNNGKDLEKLSEKYMKTALSDLSIKKNSKKIAAGDYSKKYTALSFTLDDKTVKKIAKDILKDAKKDTKLKNIILEAAELDESLDISKSDIEDAIDEALDNIDEIEFDEEVEFVIYVDNAAKIRGLTINEDSSDFELFYADVNKGNNFATDFSLSASGQTLIDITGEGKEKSKKRTGGYTVAVSDGTDGDLADVCTIEVDGFSSGPLKGEIALSLSADAYNGIGGVDSSVANIIKDGKLILNIDKSTNKEFEGSLSIGGGDVNILNIDINSKVKRGSDIDFPDDYTSSESTWQGGLDLMKIMSRLNDTGISLTDLMQ